MFKFNYKQGVFFISLLLIICLSLGAVSAVDNVDYINNDSVDIVSANIEDNNDINVSNLDINADDNSNISTVSANTQTFKSIQDAITAAKAGDTIRLNGNYAGNSTIYIDKELTIDGCGATLLGTGSSIFSISGNKSVVKNINFVSDGEIHTNNAGAIYWLGVNGKLINCTFSLFNVNGTGGAVYWKGSSGNLSGCTFSNCQAGSEAGSVYWSGVSGSLTNSKFINSSSLSSGSISWVGKNGILSNSVFNNSYSRFSGGALTWSGGSGNIYKCDFIKCSSIASHAGAIYISGVNDIINNCNFVNCSVNSSTSDGGAIYWNNNNGTLINSNFTDCTSTQLGGAISLSQRAIDVKVDNCNFRNCLARSSYETSGGAIYVDGSAANSNFKLTNSVFDNCQAKYGGAIYLRGSNNLVDYCEFNNCYASGSGGAVSIDGDLAILNHSSFNKCHSVFAGAIYWSASNGHLDFSDFIECYAYGYDLAVSGSVSWVGSDGKLTNCNFVNSYSTCDVFISRVENANAYGGAVSWYGPNGILANSTFTNSSVNITQYTYGGAVYWAGDNGNIISCIFINSTSNGTLKGCGGAVYLVSEDGKIIECNFINSTSASNVNSYGGAVYLDEIGNGFLTNSTFENSNAKYGHAIYACSTNIYNSSFVINTNENSSQMVYGVSLDLLLSQANVLGSKSITTSNQDISTNLSSKINLIAYVVNEDSEKINEGSVSFYRNGTFIGSANVVNGVANYSYTCDVVGVFNIKAVYTGSNKYTSSFANSKLTVSSIILKTSTSVDATSASYGSVVLLTAHVNSSVVVDGGSVTFKVNGNVVGTGTVNGGVATCAYSCNVVGNFVVDAIYSGSDVYSSSSGSSSLSVGMLSTVVSMDSLSVSCNAYITLTARVTSNGALISGGSVTFKVNGNVVGTGTVNGGVATCAYSCNVVGNFVVDAIYSGSDVYSSSSGSSSLSVGMLSTEISIKPIYCDYGSNITLNVFITPDSINEGNVTFKVNGTIVGVSAVVDGVATCSYYCSKTGSFNVEVIYGGSAAYGAASSTTTINVNKLSAVISVDAISASYDDAVTLTANVNYNGNPINEGLVSFYREISEGNIFIGSANVVNGVATCSYTCDEIGNFNLVAIYEGTDVYQYFSTKRSLGLVVNKISTSTSVSLGVVYYKDLINITAHVNSANHIVNDGVVIFKIGGVEVGSANVVNGVASYSYDRGNSSYTRSVNLIASYSGSDIYGVSQTPTVAVNITQLPTSTSINEVSTSYGSVVILTAHVNSIRGIVNEGVVDFYVDNRKKGSGNVVNGVATYSYTCNSIGTFSIKASYRCSGYNQTSGTSTLNVGNLATSISVDDVVASYGDNIILTAYVSDSLGAVEEGTVTFYVSGVEVGSASVSGGVATCSYNCDNVGTFSIDVDYSCESSASYSSASASLIINKLNTLISLESFNYSGDVLYFKVNVNSSLNVNEGNVTFYVNNTKVGSANVVNGVAYCNCTYYSTGIFNLKVEYSGSNLFNSSIFNSQLNIESLSTTTSVGDVVASYGDVVNLTAHVNSNDKVDEGFVSFYVDGVLVDTVDVVNGVATCSYTCNKTGVLVVEAVYSGCDGFNPSSGTSSLNVGGLVTTTSVDAISASYSSVVILTARVNSTKGIINVGSVTFYVNNTKVNVVNVVNGVATCSYTCNKTGVLVVEAVYENGGDSSNGSNNLTVVNLGTSISIEDVSASYGDNINLTANVLDEKNQPVNVGSVTFYVNNVKVGSASVSGGVATCAYSCNVTGDSSIKVTYNGIEGYDSSEKSCSLNFVKLTTIITMDEINSSYNKKINIRVNIADNKNQPVNVGSVTFYVNNVKVGSASVSGGVATIYDYVCNVTGISNIKAIYEGSDIYESSETTSKLNVASLATSISVVDVVASYGSVVNLTARVTNKDIIVNEGIVTFYVGGVEIGSANVVNGVATCSYNCGSTGNLTIKAIYNGFNKYNNSEDEGNLIVSNLATSISVVDVVASYGDVVNLTAYINSNIPVNNGHVIFYKDGNIIGSADVVNGKATYSYNCSTPGNFILKAEYEGFNYFNSSSATAKLNISKSNTTVVVNNISASYGDVVNLTVKVLSDKGTTVNEGIVTVYINDKYVNSVNVVNGQAICSYNCDNAGNLIINVNYMGSNNYKESNSSSNLIIDGLNTKISVGDVTTSYGSVVNLTANILDEDNQRVNGGNVTFKVDGNIVGTAIVYNGVATYSYTCDKSGNFSITASYNGYNMYKPSESSSKGTMIKSSTSTYVNPVYATYNKDSSVTLIANITASNGEVINGGIVTFYMNNTEIGSTSVSGGVAKYIYTLNPTDIGDYDLKAFYSGFDKLDSSMSIARLSIRSLDTVSKSNSSIASYGDVVTFKVSVTSDIVVNEGIVTFYMNNTEIGSANVVNGVATYSYTLNKEFGIYDIKTQYSGSKYFASSSSLSTLTIDVPTVISIDSYSSTYKQVVTFNANVKSIFGEVINNGNVTFYVNDTKVGVANVVGGVASYSYTCTQAGKFVLKVVYTSNSESSQNTSELFVNKANAKITVSINGSYYKATKINVKLTDDMGNPISNEKVFITISGKNVSVVTNANGIATYNVPNTPGSYNYAVALNSDNWKFGSTGGKITINKATSVTLAPTKLSTTYNSKAVFQVKVYKGSALFVGVKLKLKVYTGKKYKTVTVTTNANGIAQYTDASVLSVAKHKVSVSCGESKSYMAASSKTSYITIKKAPTVVSAPKVTNKYKKSAYFTITLKMKSTGYNLPAGVIVKIKVYTGKKYKTYKVKTNSNGVAKLNTKSLAKGTHKVVISSGHIYYTISKSGKLIVIK